MARKGCDRLLPLPCSPGKPRHVVCLRATRLWRLILRRRSQSDVPWDRVTLIFSRWIPVPRVLHPYPIASYSAIPRYASQVGAVCVEALVRFCAEGAVMIVPTATIWTSGCAGNNG